MLLKINGDGSQVCLKWLDMSGLGWTVREFLVSGSKTFKDIKHVQNS